jgi:hypothetical protein
MISDTDDIRLREMVSELLSTLKRSIGKPRTAADKVLDAICKRPATDRLDNEIVFAAQESLDDQI